MSYTVDFSKSDAPTNKTTTLPFSFSTTSGNPLPSNLLVDWGDDSEPLRIKASNEAPSELPSHTYADNGPYTITIKSDAVPGGSEAQVPTLSFADKKELTGVSSHLLLSDGDKLQDVFKDCSNLVSIPAVLFEKYTGTISFYGTFEGCTSLQTIPAELFKYNTNATEFNRTFQGCTSLGTSQQPIPANLFKYNTNATKFADTFNGCTALAEIPTDLFIYNTHASSFNATFKGCTSITAIPEDLFKYNTQQQTGASGESLYIDFNYTFSGCTSITAIPGNLFKENANAKYFNDTFRGCTGLNTAIPSGLFDNNTAAINFAGTFQDCSNLPGPIPAGLFKQTKGRSFEGTFDGCSSLGSEENAEYAIPADLFPTNPEESDTNPSIFGNTFRGCSSLRGPIPEALFSNFSKVSRFDGVFQGCSGLTGSIPATLFARNPEVTTFSNAFRDCTGLTGAIPAGLFAVHSVASDFAGAFSGCTKLYPSEDMFIDNDHPANTRFTSSELTSLNFNLMFWNCASDSSLEEYDEEYELTLSFTLPKIWDPDTYPRPNTYGFTVSHNGTFGNSGDTGYGIYDYATNWNDVPDGSEPEEEDWIEEQTP